MDKSLDLRFENSFANTMEGFYAEATPAPVATSNILASNTSLGAILGMTPKEVELFASRYGAGAELPVGAQPLAQVYAGHQFGSFNPRLGDGRALLLGEVIGRDGIRRDIQLKGSGPTVFSRGGDGKAAIGPVLREYLMGEALHALGIPTTRMLAAVATGVPVYREHVLPGAVVTRVAKSHLRIGTFQYFAARGEKDQLNQLIHYAVQRHFPELEGSTTLGMDLVRAVARNQGRLIAKWMSIGFIHGVMNTDNMAISGETIDFGPCAMMDTYHPRTVFSSIDRMGRYAFGNQPSIGQWNLARFAEAILHATKDPSEADIQEAHEALQDFSNHYHEIWTTEMLEKLGITQPEEQDASLITGFLQLLQETGSDYTSTFRKLGNYAQYSNAEEWAEEWSEWLGIWESRLESQDGGREGAALRMDHKNPIVIPRNHLVEETLSAALEGDLAPFHALLERVVSPFELSDEDIRYALPASAEFTDSYQTFCGT